MNSYFGKLTFSTYIYRFVPKILFFASSLFFIFFTCKGKNEVKFQKKLLFKKKAEMKILAL